MGQLSAHQHLRAEEFSELIRKLQARLTETPEKNEVERRRLAERIQSFRDQMPYSTTGE